MRKTALAPGQLLSSVHMEKSYHGKAGYPVLYKGLPSSRSCPGEHDRKMLSRDQI